MQEAIVQVCRTIVNFGRLILIYIRQAEAISMAFHAKCGSVRMLKAMAEPREAPSLIHAPERCSKC